MANVYVRDGVEEVPPELLEQFVHQLFKRVTDEVRARSEISEQEKIQFEDEADAFRRHLQTILSGKSRYQEPALRALARALSFSFYHGGGTAVVRELRAKGVSVHNSAAGKGSGKARHSTAEETWRPHALELAKESRKQTPSGTLDDVATYILDNWKLKIEPPRREWLKRFISNKTKDDSLPARVKAGVSRNRAKGK